MTEVKYLGLIIITENICIDPKKMLAIVNQELPTSIKKHTGISRTCRVLPIFYYTIFGRNYITDKNDKKYVYDNILFKKINSG